MVSNGFTIADPNDGGMLDVVGFDATVPQIMADFLRG
jgi:60 kDa SS-A/Ro ribonucleoprotein